MSARSLSVRIKVATSSRWRDPDAVRAAANAAQLFTVPIGVTGGNWLVFDLIDRGIINS